MGEPGGKNKPPAEGRGSGFVLVVDSDAQSLVIMAMILQRLGYLVCTANAADKALEMAHYSPPSLVIAAMDLRGMTGLALMHRLRDEVRTAAVPVLIMTREHDRDFSKRCGDAGAAGALPIPVQANDLYQAINRIINPRSRRADFRIPTSLPAMLNGRALDAGAGEAVTNLSVNGVYLRSRTTFTVQTLVRIDLTLHGETITAEARVVYLSPAGAGNSGLSGMGLQFTSISPRGREIIRAFIHTEVTHGLAPGMA
ncbi:MAG: response regulator [Nitrospirota bacterium]|nr:response regulator [Nitrospirota bacterium]